MFYVQCSPATMRMALSSLFSLIQSVWALALGKNRLGSGESTVWLNGQTYDNQLWIIQTYGDQLGDHCHWHRAVACQLCVAEIITQIRISLNAVCVSEVFVVCVEQSKMSIPENPSLITLYRSEPEANGSRQHGCRFFTRQKGRQVGVGLMFVCICIHYRKGARSHRTNTN